MKMEWSGDVDLNNGELQKQYKAYRDEISFINSLSCDDRSKLKQSIETLSERVVRDMEFAITGEFVAVASYLTE